MYDRGRGRWTNRAKIMSMDTINGNLCPGHKRLIQRDLLDCGFEPTHTNAELVYRVAPVLPVFLWNEGLRNLRPRHVFSTHRLSFHEYIPFGGWCARTLRAKQ